MLRDFKLRLRIIWLLLTNQYTKSDSHSCWWLWKTNLWDEEEILITFDKKTFKNRSCGFDKNCKCEWKKK